jgi:L-lactate dehydrogenase (cytochrome)
MPTLTCVEDLRQQYVRRVPRIFVDYAENGSYQEETLAANRRDFEAIKFDEAMPASLTGTAIPSCAALHRTDGCPALR